MLWFFFKWIYLAKFINCIPQNVSIIYTIINLNFKTKEVATHF